MFINNNNNNNNKTRNNLNNKTLKFIMIKGNTINKKSK